MANLRVDKITSTETFETTGSVQFVRVPSSRLTTDLGSGLGDNFTIEFWILASAIAPGSSSPGMFQLSDTSGGLKASTESLSLAWSTSNNYSIFYAGSIGTGSITNDPNTNDVWKHYAMVRNNGVLKIYVDGIEKTSVNLTDDFSGYRYLAIGTYYSTSYPWQGYISNFRILNNKALYTSNFKPPMRELEVTPETVLLACQSKTDATLEKTGKTIAVNGNAVASELTPGILTPVPKAGAGSAITGSVEFTSTNDALVLSAGEDFAYGTGDFTIEAWIQPQGVNGGETKAIFTQTQSGNDYIVFKVDSDKAIKATFGSTTVSGGTVEVGSWHHVAVTRASNTVKIFVNGVASAGTTVSTDFSDTTRNPTIGQYTHTYGNIEYYGFISNLRVVKGTALYTDDFIPPTRELKKVPGTVLLCCQDPDNPLTEATGKTITGYGDLSPGGGSNLISNAYDADAPGDTTGWSTDQGASLSVSSGRLRVTNGISDYGIAQTSVTTLTGQRYVARVDFHPGTANQGELRASNTSFSNTLGGSGLNALAPKSLTFTAASTTTYINVYGSNTTGEYSEWTNFSVTLAEGSNKGSNFTPQVGDDRKVTFEGVTKINSDAYFYLPTGDTVTRESRSGYGNRGLFSLGAAPTAVNTIEFVNIASTGDSQNFGDLTYEIDGSNASCSSSTRGIFGGGRESPANVNIINYVTIATQGDAKDFGDLTQIRRGITGHGSSIRGIFAAGRADPGPNPTDTIDFITIASTGNALDFGNLITARRYSGSTSSSTRGLVAGGADPGKLNSIEYVTIPSKGNAQDFGDLSNNVDQTEGNSNGVRGIFGGGGSHPTYYNTIDYVTIASTGNAKDFGDLLYTRVDSASASNCIRGVFAGGHNPTKFNDIQYVNISSMGNAFDFGSLSATSAEGSGCSDSHGGLG